MDTRRKNSLRLSLRGEVESVWLGGLETNFRAKSSLKPWVPEKFRSLRFASEVPSVLLA